jgi:hypothetical protein
MTPRRFDQSRLRAVEPSPGAVRHCPASDALVAACRQGAAPLTRAWAVLETADPAVARRACLQLDGSWDLADASGWGRMQIRVGALLSDLVWWRPARPGDYWDAGWAADPAVLRGFVPRRATLIVIRLPLREADRTALADLADRAEQGTGFRHALRCLMVRPI